ncbi:MAG: CoA-binding protein [Desulfobacterales bacterium]|nr:CoA-binding protein [Desulfobacterales bacterium]
MEKVAVIGASPLEDRYSHKAMKMLMEYGHDPIPVVPKHKEILGKTVSPRLAEVEDAVDTVTLYVGPARQEPVIEDIIAKKPKRVIFNPGTENPDAYEKLKAAGIEVSVACTLVLLKTNQY